MSNWAEPTPEAARPGDWADPGFFSNRLSQGGRFWRLLWSMLLPPEGKRTIPTPAGYVLILISLGLGMAAYSTSSNILFMALSLMLSSLILSGFMSWLNFKGTQWRLNLPSHFRAGDTADLQIELHNIKKLLPTYNIWFNIRTQEQPDNRRIFLDERLDPDKTKRLDWTFQPQKRGQDAITISGLESQFPFGFLRKVIGGGIHRTITVFPARIDYSFKPPTGHRSHRQGETNRRHGAGAELINIRNYQRGDPQRLVHWKATARLRHVMIRQMAEENRDGYVLFIETPDATWKEGEQLETLFAMAGSLAEDLFRDGRLIGYAVNDEPITSIKRLHDLHAFLHVLAELKPVAHYAPAQQMNGQNLITFRPGSGQSVNAFIGGNLAGTA